MRSRCSAQAVLVFSTHPDQARRCSLGRMRLIVLATIEARRGLRRCCCTPP
jgi:hypothetical protein